MRRSFSLTSVVPPLLIPYARDGRNNRKVSLPNHNLQPGGEWYEESVHKGHLLCPDCSAHVHFVPASESKGGGNIPGSRAHFATNPGQKHDEKCFVEQKRELNQSEKAESEVDKSKGFRINLNSFSRTVTADLNLSERFGVASRGPYQRESRIKTRIKASEQDLKHLESVSISNVGDMIEFLKSKDPERIAQSVVIHRDFKLPWRYFMLSYNPQNNDHKKFKLFVSAMRDHGQTLQPVLMEIIVDKRHTPESIRVNNCVKSKAIFSQRQEGQPEWIMPRIYMEHRNGKSPYVFLDPGRYLVLGIAKLKTIKERGQLNHYLSISVSDDRQIQRADLPEIRAENKRRQELRDRRSVSGKLTSPNPVIPG